MSLTALARQIIERQRPFLSDIGSLLIALDERGAICHGYALPPLALVGAAHPLAPLNYQDAARRAAAEQGWGGALLINALHVRGDKPNRIQVLLADPGKDRALPLLFRIDAAGKAQPLDETALDRDEQLNAYSLDLIWRHIPLLACVGPRLDEEERADLQGLCVAEEEEGLPESYPFTCEALARYQVSARALEDPAGLAELARAAAQGWRELLLWRQLEAQEDDELEMAPEREGEDTTAAGEDVEAALQRAQRVYQGIGVQPFEERAILLDLLDAHDPAGAEVVELTNGFDAMSAMFLQPRAQDPQPLSDEGAVLTYFIGAHDERIALLPTVLEQVEAEQVQHFKSYLAQALAAKRVVETSALPMGPRQFALYVEVMSPEHGALAFGLYDLDDPDPGTALILDDEVSLARRSEHGQAPFAPMFDPPPFTAAEEQQFKAWRLAYVTQIAGAPRSRP
jgi:hypothetical protein